ncbi:DMT family transporter [Alloalcanivorax gelatiniphagus]|uniref:Spermidine export protein MdtJ n=1 Tax=Alloalcanivorax gelatiniphagus TaxID=1194167 RepID=A0ABY2XRL8_9GAMM|nr:multidrug efflux SMR transporter [Alloalcanivorax gelatiniphagus]TMW14843.1 multidrug efflux SMR transporter [Alloalcanivorax gelatiniphagus]|tara:strand:+ start:4675 stop:5016 length:342 start_codon:yes stop_codon:yes gene_type:complete
MNPWFFLLAAIACEVLGTSLMKLANVEAPLLGHLAMYVLITLAYYFLARAMERIPLGIAYALWEAVGLVLIALVGVVVFSESLSPWQALGLFLLLGGIGLLNGDTANQAEARS